MRKLFLSAILTSAFFTQSNAQTLFTYGNNAVSENEFLSVYKKNNATKSIDYSSKAVNEYIDLYSLFRMKVQEANAQHLDTAASVSAELDNYRKQLSKNYLTDDEVASRLVKEAYDRSKEEIHVAHILITCSPSDTTAAFHKIDSLYKAITEKKADFGEIAKLYSDDKGTKNNGGDIGFMTSLQTIYPFENAVYNTQVGKVSAPFRTQFGYHILKVIEKRPARGEVKVAQILIATPKSLGAAGIIAARLRVDSVQNALKKGASFESLVKQYSQDKLTVDKNGEMPILTVGGSVPAFEQAAFGLKNVGDISKPVQTDYGFHIIKLLGKYPLKPFDSVRKHLKTKVDNDSRAQQARDLYFERVKQTNGFKNYPEAFESLVKQTNLIADTGKNAGAFNTDMFKGGTNTMFAMGGHNYTQNDFLSFAVTTTRGRLMGSKQSLFRDLYNMYQSKVVNDFQEHKLVEENPEFRSLMQEYKDGIMLFELMDRNVWGKASKDTVGLKTFYESKKDKYTWEPGFKGSVYTFKDETSLKEGLKLLAQKDITNEEVAKTLNTDKKGDAVAIQQGRYEFNKFTEVPSIKIIAGKVSDPVTTADKKYIVVKAADVYSQPVTKTFTEARGYVISAYQDYLEKQWNDQLRAKYPVKINDDVLKKIVK